MDKLSTEFGENRVDYCLVGWHVRQLFSTQAEIRDVYRHVYDCAYIKAIQYAHTIVLDMFCVISITLYAINMIIVET